MPTVTPKLVADFTTQLDIAIAVGGTTGGMTLDVDDDGVALPDGLYYLTLDGQNSGKEYISCTNTAGLLSNISSISRQGVATSGAMRAHRVGATVEMTDWLSFKAYIDNLSLAGVVNASQSTNGIVQVATAAQINAGTGTGSSGAPVAITPDQFAISTYASAITTLNAYLAAQTGIISPYSGRVAPTGYLLCQGQSVARATYPNLFPILYPSATVSSISIGTSALITTSTTHGFLAGDQVSFQTTGGLPSGLTAGVNYYVISSGLTTTAFELSTFKGGPAITTSGSQSGVHTAYLANWGTYNGTNFVLPDLRTKFLMGAGQGSFTVTTDSTQIAYQQSGAFSTGNDAIVTSNNHNLVVGSRVQISSSGGGVPGQFANNLTYFVVRVDNSKQFALAASPGGTSINSGSTLSANIIAGSIFTGSTDGPYLGQAVVYSKNGGTAITGLTDGTTYYVIPGLGAGEIMLATTAANAASANNPITGAQNAYQINMFIALTAVGVGVHTFTYTYSNRNTGQFGGEETHELSNQEHATHVHGLDSANTRGVASSQYIDAAGTNSQTGQQGGNVPHNNLPPFATVNYIIKT